VGERSGETRGLIDGYKFERQRAAHRPLADLLLQCIDQLPEDTVIVPVPTIAPHIRLRGYDHMYLIARYFARKRGLELCSVLHRTTTTRQRGASRAQRMLQAQKAFEVRRDLDPDKHYLLIDDVITTGSTLAYASQALLDAGAGHVWVAAIARQPLD
jgi:ComF family protein